MPWEEVYYEHYKENMCGKYWEEEKSLPYVIGFETVEERDEFGEFLSSEGFERMNWGTSTRGMLVNMKFLRWAAMEKAAGHSSIDGRSYKPDEFVREILEPWKISREQPTAP